MLPLQLSAYQVASTPHEFIILLKFITTHNKCEEDIIRASQVALVVKNVRPMQETQGRRFNLWVGKISWKRAWQPTPVFLPGEFQGWRSLEGYSPQGCTASDTTEVTAHAHTQILLARLCKWEGDITCYSSQCLLVKELGFKFRSNFKTHALKQNIKLEQKLKKKKPSLFYVFCVQDT